MAVDNFIEEHPPWQRLLSNISGNDGGGGATLGSPTSGSTSTSEVAVGSTAETFPIGINKIKLGDSVIVDAIDSVIIPSKVASGLDVLMFLNDLTFVNAYDVTVDGNTGQYSTVEEIDIDEETITLEIEGEAVQALEYTVPMLAENHVYVVYCTQQS